MLYKLKAKKNNFSVISIKCKIFIIFFIFCNVLLLTDQLKKYIRMNK